MHNRPYISLIGFIYLFAFSLHANTGITIDDVSVRVSEHVVTVDCDVTYDVDEKIKNALSNGVELAFILDLELVEDNQYWLNRSIGSFNYMFFLKYHALSQQYILKDKNNERSFP